eukprot:1429353-Pyramimonas_sp.AAC.1
MGAAKGKRCQSTTEAATSADTHALSVRSDAQARFAAPPPRARRRRRPTIPRASWNARRPARNRSAP